VTRSKTFRVERGGPDPARVEEILRALPGWFGIEDALLNYVDQSKTLPAFVALMDDKMVGICSVKQHTQHAAEIYLMAVDPSLHRFGIGTALLKAAERELRDDGVQLLQVKTLGPSDPSPEYATTRLFYEAVGFRALEEIEGLWPGNPCLILVKHLDAREGSTDER
jgi:GNAT superfamily N-acetyltransferase